ncbi:MAG: hypothetical protein J1E62_08795 [Lachnospiraceae bacterium]|nr:hypothetical protein [Lachnospiraceae bacterium]
MKKTGYIIYQPSELQKNSIFVEMFQRAGEQQGLEFISCTIDNYRSLPQPDFVLNRTRDYRVSAYYERHHIPVFHRTELVRMGNDKAETLRILQENRTGKRNLRIPDSLVLLPEDSRDESVFWDKINVWRKENSLTGRDIVVKTVDGHGGQEVFLIKDFMEKEEVQAISVEKNSLSQIKKEIKCPAVLAGKKILCQPMIDCDSRDIRVYILGGEVYHSVLRQGKGDFRSNYSMGGTVSEYFLSPEQYREVQDYIDCMGGEALAMAGIDFFLDRRGQLVFNEVEEMVGSRMLYACSDKDIVKDYVAWLAQIL